MRRQKNKHDCYQTAIDFATLTKIPIYHMATSAGYGTPLDGEEDYEYVSIPRELTSQCIEPLGFKVSGNSMYPEIKHRDLLVLDVADKIRLSVRSGQYIVAVLNGAWTVKKIVFKENGDVWLVPENSSYEPYYLTTDDDFHIIGIVKHKITSY